MQKGWAEPGLKRFLPPLLHPPRRLVGSPFGFPRHESFPLFGHDWRYVIECLVMAKVYLETSFFSACVTTRTDVDSQSWKGRSLSWLKTQAPRHQLAISAEVIAE